MECAGNQDYETYTRYRAAAATVMQPATLGESASSMVLLLTISVIWGCVLFAALGVMV